MRYPVLLSRYHLSVWLVVVNLGESSLLSVVNRIDVYTASFSSIDERSNPKL